MHRLTTYVIAQMLGPFVFFVLVFTGVIWLTQSLRVIDTVVNNGQSASVFLEFTLLLLPRVMTVVLPVATFAAALYAVNRLFTDSEIVVMLAAGMSARALLVPVGLFAGAVFALTLAIAVWLQPLTQSAMRDRIAQVRGDVAAAFIREGTFMQPATGVSVYVREIGRPGEMLGIFIHDARDPAEVATYTAERAVLLGQGDEAAATGSRLVMFDGIAQIADEANPAALSVLRFDQLGYDLGQFTGGEGARRRKPSEMFVTELLAADEAAAKAAGRTIGEYRAEAHEALSAPLYVLALPLIAVGMVVSAGFRRQGFTGRIVASAAVAVALRLAGLAAKSVTAGMAAAWPIMYLPPVLGCALALLLLSGLSLAPRRAWREAPA